MSVPEQRDQHDVRHTCPECKQIISTDAVEFFTAVKHKLDEIPWWFENDEFSAVIEVLRDTCTEYLEWHEKGRDEEVRYQAEKALLNSF